MILRFWRKTVFYGVLWKIRFCCISEKFDFTVLARKLDFTVFVENSILRFWRKIDIKIKKIQFCDFGKITLILEILTFCDQWTDRVHIVQIH